MYFPWRTGIRSLIGRPNTHSAGDCFVEGSGLFRYWSITFWNASIERSPSVPVFPAISLLMVFTPISALQLLWG